MKQETANGTIIIPYWKSAPYWPLIYTNIAGVCTFEKFVVDSKIVSSKIIKREFIYLLLISYNILI